MTIQQYFQTSMVGLKTNKSRSFLTILGIVIGIAAIILIMSLGQGAQNLILAQVQGLGTKSVVVVPGKVSTSGPPSSTDTDSLKDKDLVALNNKFNVPHAASVIPVIFGSEVASVDNLNYRGSVYGSSELLPNVFDAQPNQGTFFTEDDVKSNSSIVIIGSKVNEKLFPNNDGLGKRIKIKDRSFKVVGILPEKGSSSVINFDDGLILPYTTAQNYLFGVKYFDRILIDIDDEKNIESSVQSITDTIRTSHNITDPDKDDFTIVNQADLAKRLGVITSALTYFLAAVASISLLVGGIGIMNIMLVSVTERTREIGLRKAVGATNKNILTQFLFESVTLTLVGGLIGILLGAAGSFIASFILSNVVHLNWAFTFPISAAILGLGVSGGVGLTFGLYPANQAAKKSPIEALRYE